MGVEQNPIRFQARPRALHKIEKAPRFYVERPCLRACLNLVDLEAKLVRLFSVCQNKNTQNPAKDKRRFRHLKRISRDLKILGSSPETRLRVFFPYF